MSIYEERAGGVEAGGQKELNRVSIDLVELLIARLSGNKSLADLQDFMTKMKSMNIEGIEKINTFDYTRIWRDDASEREELIVALRQIKEILEISTLSLVDFNAIFKMAKEDSHIEDGVEENAKKEEEQLPPPSSKNKKWRDTKLAKIICYSACAVVAGVAIYGITKVISNGSDNTASENL